VDAVADRGRHALQDVEALAVGADVVGEAGSVYGDRLSAAREMVEGGPIDVLTGDYLAELTMLILLKD
jgi:DUF917 family protein